VHARDISPDTGIAGFCLIDDFDTADTFAPQAISQAYAALAATDDHDIVVDACSRPHPVGWAAPSPTQHAAGLRFEVLACLSKAGSGAGRAR
jgi:hypothetical protein